MIRPTPTSPRSRPGVVAVALLVVLLGLVMIAMSLLRAGLAQRGETRAAERRVQAGLLADAAIRRAVHRLKSDPGYTGETWAIDARALDSADAASVRIDVERGRADPSERTIRVRADYPLDEPRRIRCTRRSTVRLPGAKTARPG